MSGWKDLWDRATGDNTPDIPDDGWFSSWASTMNNAIVKPVKAWFNPEDNPRLQTMSDEQIANENIGFMTPPDENEAPIKHLMGEAWQGANSKTDPMEHRLSNLRDAPLVGGAIRYGGELLLNTLQASERGILAPAIGSLVDQKAAPNFDFMTKGGQDYKDAIAAFYKLPAPLQMGAQLLDPIQALGGAATKGVVTAKALKEFNVALDVAQRAGNADDVKRILDLGEKVSSLDNTAAQKALRESLPYMNVEARTAQQVAMDMAKQGRMGAKAADVVEGVPKAGLGEKIKSMVDLTRPTNTNYAQRAIETVGEMNLAIQEAVGKDTGAFTAAVNSIVNGDIPKGLEFMRSTRGKEYVAVMRALLAPDNVNPLTYTGRVDTTALDKIVQGALSEVMARHSEIQKGALLPEGVVREMGNEIIAKLSRKTEEAAKIFYPDQPKNFVQTILGKSKTFDAYRFMGYSPGYVVRNMISNYVPAIVDGTFSLENHANILNWIDEFGAPPSAFRAFGSAEVGDIAVDLARKSMWETLTDKGLSGLIKAPFLKIGQAVEVASSVRIYKNAAKRVYDKMWQQQFIRPQMPPEVAQRLGAQAAALDNAIQHAYSVKAINKAVEDVMGAAGMVRTRQSLPAEIADVAAKFDGLDEELRELSRKSGNMTPEDVRNATARIYERYNENAQKAAKAVSRDQELAEEAAIRTSGKAEGKAPTVIEKEVEELQQAKAKGGIEKRRQVVDTEITKLAKAVYEKGDPIVSQGFENIRTSTRLIEAEGWWRRLRYQGKLDKMVDREANQYLIDTFSADKGMPLEEYLAKNYPLDPQPFKAAGEKSSFTFIQSTFNDEIAKLEKSIGDMKAAVAKADSLTDDMKAKLTSLGYGDADLAGYEKNVTEAQRIIATQAKKNPDVVAPVAAQPAPKVVETTPAGAQAAGPLPPQSNNEMVAEATQELVPEVGNILKQYLDWMTQHWDETATAADAGTVNSLRAWVDGQVVPAMQQTKIVAQRYGVAMRDAALHNYSDRRNIDTLLAYVYPFSFWYTRSFARWAERAARNPAAMHMVIDATQAQAEQEKDLPLAWRNQIKLPGFDDNPYFINARALIDPFYQSLYNSLGSTTKTGGTAENMVAKLAGWGATLHTPIIAAMAGMGQLQDPNDWLSYQTSFSRPIKAISALMREKGIATGIIPPGGIVIDEPLRQMVSPILQASGKAVTGKEQMPLLPRDQYEYTRAGKQLMTAFEKNEINPETGKPITKDEMSKAMTLQSGPLWEMAMQKEGTSQALPQLSSALIGAAVKQHDVDELTLQRARDEYYTVIKPMKESDPDGYKKAMTEFDAKYPWYFSVNGIQYNNTPEKRQAAYEKERGYTVLLERMPPGYKKTLTTEESALVDKFYANKGDFALFSPTEQKLFSGMMDKLEKANPEPSPEEAAQRAKAKEVIGQYYDLKDAGNQAAATALWKANSALLSKYYGSTSSSSYSYSSSSSKSSGWYSPSKGRTSSTWTPYWKPGTIKKAAVPKGKRKVG